MEAGCRKYLEPPFCLGAQAVSKICILRSCRKDSALCCSLFRVGGIYQLLIGSAFRQFSGRLQYILEQFEAVLTENQIRFPGVLLIIAVYDGGDGGKFCLRELGRNYFSDLFRCVGLHIVHALLESICKGLDDLRIFRHIAGFGAEGRVGYVAGILAKRRNNIAVPLFLQSGGGWLEFNGVLSLSAREGCCGGAKINALINFQIGFRIDAVLFQDVFKYHFRHAACRSLHHVNHGHILIHHYFLPVFRGKNHPLPSVILLLF